MSKNKKLGSNPLDWIGKDPNIVVEKQKEKPPSEKKVILEKRETFILKTDLTEKIKDYAYWERITQKDVINSILESFFKDNPVKPRPSDK